MTLIPAPAWADPPRIMLRDMWLDDYEAIQEHRDRLVAAVHKAVEKYLNTRGLSFTSDEDGFPNRTRMTGEYYLSDEYYEGNRPDGFKINVHCRCLEKPWQPGATEPDDYLGLDVWLLCKPKRWTFTVQAVDSSSI
jgi:hypothetical protein